MKQKELAIMDFMEMIAKSWTWERLTEDERAYFRDEVDSADYNGAICGTYRQRWHILQWVYNAFLTGCGYRNGHFREDMNAPRF